MLVGLSLLLGTFFPLSGAFAHEGHDHADRPAAAVTASNPRVAIQSELYELVGILRGGQLTIYLDRFATNEPVPDAKMTVALGGDEEIAAESRPDGTYGVSSPKLGGSGPLELVFALTAPSGDDLLIGMLELPTKPVAGTGVPARPSASRALQSLNWHELRDWVHERLGNLGLNHAYVSAGAALLLGFCLGLAMRGGGRRRHRLVPASAAILIALLATTSLAQGHEGEAHGNDAKPAVLPTADGPRRLPDGTVFVPKPSQRLLEVRTALSKPEKASRAVNLIGRVIADPNRGGVVQSLNGGRVIAPEKGLPRIGQTVRKGDVLALIEPALPQADRTTISERAGEIEQQIAVAETRLNRIRPLAQRGIIPQSQVLDAETEIEGLRRRREIVGRTRVEPEILRASANGVIAATKVAAGQVVQAQDILFQIVDPRGFWVEALVYDELNPAEISEASATANDGRALKLALQGFSRALQQQASIVQFAVLDPPPSINVGQPVTVIAKEGATVEGVIMPRAAVVRGGNGEAMVWRHTDPERFEPRPVRTEPFDATRLLIRAGVAAGERIVTRGAELINQIR